MAEKKSGPNIPYSATSKAEYEAATKGWLDFPTFHEKEKEKMAGDLSKFKFEYKKKKPKKMNLGERINYAIQQFDIQRGSGNEDLYNNTGKVYKGGMK